ncbi:MAG: MaoC family dehydratase N-terminal domain-containing protein [Planctomycetes bacterium]|nr:MaoC family dehydratase N-terminal domain-containing protein [Planctomycetota bacterium]
MSSDAAPGPRPLGPAFRGRGFDDFQLGEVIRSGARTLTQADIGAFAGLSGDFNPAHVDESFASASAFRGTIAHGMLVQSVASGLAYQTGVFDGTVVAFVEMTIRFQAPVRPGSSIHLELTVAEKEPNAGPKRAWIRFDARVFDQSGELVLDGHWILLIARAQAKRRYPVRSEDRPG